MIIHLVMEFVFIFAIAVSLCRNTIDKRNNYNSVTNKNALFFKDLAKESKISYNKKLKHGTNGMKSKALFSIEQLKENTKKDILYQSEVGGSCFCGNEYQLLDLGKKYFPRYLQSMKCQQKSCGNLYRCLARFYKVRVLRLKNGLEKKGVVVPSVPANIKKYWVTEDINVVVACECYQ